MRQRYPLLGGSDTHAIARAHGELGLTSATRSTWVDVSTWLPRVVTRAERTLTAARGPDGAWLAYVLPGGGRAGLGAAARGSGAGAGAAEDRWVLRWYPALDANVPVREEPEPVAIRDVGQRGQIAPFAQLGSRARSSDGAGAFAADARAGAVAADARAGAVAADARAGAFAADARTGAFAADPRAAAFAADPRAGAFAADARAGAVGADARAGAFAADARAAAVAADVRAGALAADTRTGAFAADARARAVAADARAGTVSTDARARAVAADARAGALAADSRARAFAADARAGAFELADTTRLESVHLLGAHAVVVPRHVGLGEHRHPFVAIGERWVEAVALPPFAKPAARHRERCAAACLRLADGTDVIVWDGHVFAFDGAEFTRRFEHRLALRWYDDFAPVSFGAAGLLACDRGALVELGPGGVTAHLPGVTARSVRRGPDAGGRATYVVGTISVPLLWSPDDDWICELGPELLGRRGDVAGALPDGDLVVYDPRAVDLTRVPAAEWQALPRRRASDAHAAPRPRAPGQPVLDDVGAAARPRIAGAGDQVVVASEHQLRFHLASQAVGVERWAAPIVAVAHDGRHAAALDAQGTLRLLRGVADGGPQSVRVAGVPRSLAAGPDGTWIVVVAHGAWLVDFRAIARHGAGPEPIALPGALTAAVDPDGTILLVAERDRVATWRAGALLELPAPIEQLVACAPLGAGRFLCAGERYLFTLDLRDQELELLPLAGDHGAGERVPTPTVAAPLVAASPGGALIAWAPAPTTISIAAWAGGQYELVERAFYPPEYSQPLDTPLALRGLAFTSPTTLAVLLDGGRGNLLDLATRTARRLDPQLGDGASRWIFHFGGKSLIAE